MNTVGGTITGLVGSGLTLHLQETDEALVVPAAATSFEFQGRLQAGSTYHLSITKEPSAPAQTCAIENGATGSVGATSIAVRCSTDSVHVGGTITGLSGSGLTLHLQETDESLVVSASAESFQFSSTVLSGSTFHVAVAQQPGGPAQTCTFDGVSTGIAGMDGVAVRCVTDSVQVGGTIAGLAGSGLTLRLVETDETAVISAGAGAYHFGSKVLAGSTFHVQVTQNPSGPAQICSPDGSGVAGATSVAINCATSAFQVGGTVTGLGGPGLVLDLNGQTKEVATNGTFTFPTALASGTRYTVTVKGTPGPQSCTLQNGTGVIVASAITNVVVNCTNNATNVWAVGGAGTILHYSGAAWTPVSSPVSQTLNAVWGSGPYDVWAVGAGGTILHSDGGAWVPRGSGTTTNDLYAIWGSGAGDVWAVGAGGTILHWNGGLWAVESSGTSSSLLAVSGTSATDVWAVGSSGTIIHRTSAGWSTSASLSRTVSLSAVWARSSTEVWAFGYEGTWPGDMSLYNGYVYHYAGSWSQYANTGNVFPNAVWGIGDEVWVPSSLKLYMVGDRLGLLHRTGAAGAFQDYTSTINPSSSILGPLYAVWGRGSSGSTSELWIVGGFGYTVHFSGGTWTPTASGVSQPLLGVWASVQ